GGGWRPWLSLHRLLCGALRLPAFRHPDTEALGCRVGAVARGCLKRDQDTVACYGCGRSAPPQGQLAEFPDIRVHHTPWSWLDPLPGPPKCTDQRFWHLN
ncbi:hypothetical protein H1C71_003722, partial [Ictidomys tridecemlineatus]